jgi:hypothetical protein
MAGAVFVALRCDIARKAAAGMSGALTERGNTDRGSPISYFPDAA